MITYTHSGSKIKDLSKVSNSILIYCISSLGVNTSLYLPTTLKWASRLALRMVPESTACLDQGIFVRAGYHVHDGDFQQVF